MFNTIYHIVFYKYYYLYLLFAENLNGLKCFGAVPVNNQQTKPKNKRKEKLLLLLLFSSAPFDCLTTTS